MMPVTRLPTATYRVQLNQNFRFADVCKILDYLGGLGISDLYLSPILASRKGSDHGYDVADPTRLNPELGSEEDFATLQSELQNRGMGLLLDIVPNHMATGPENPWWMDVLENGSESAFAGFFDIDWRILAGRILLPVLGRPFGEALDSGEIHLALRDGKFFVQYFESQFPLAPRSYHQILNHRAALLKESMGEEAPTYNEYAGILSSFAGLSRNEQSHDETVADRRLRYESARERLSTLIKASPEVAGFVAGNLRDINGTPGDPATFAVLQGILTEQNYKLSFWQNLNDTINYRRFFTITELVGVRVEDPHVFEATHGHLLRLVARTPNAGLRVDHVDGLRDPLAYLNKLQERLNAVEDRSQGSSYILVEKILQRDETLPSDWPVSGTTGYDYLNEANGIFVEPHGAVRLEQSYSDFIGRRQDFTDILYQKKKLVMSTLLGVEMRSLGRQIAELASQDRYAREIPRGQLMDALNEVTACLPVYRTYIRNMDLPAQATAYITEAVSGARSRSPHLTPGCFHFIQEVLLLLNPPHVLPDQREARLAFVMHWQQFTGPIQAKGLEDTALYVYHPLLSTNEVGGDPRPARAATREDLGRFLQHRLESWPATLNATETHDTKRSEDVRARLNVLSEIPEEWERHLELWANQNDPLKQKIGPHVVPDRNEEYFLYQTLLGVWPLDQQEEHSILQRVQDHLIKATREAMVHTRWTRPNQPHEDALKKFTADVLCAKCGAQFLSDFRPFQQRVAYFGMINSLSQVLLKITSPGVADFYQGSELWDLRLVDPDNRGPIDFARRSSMLQSISSHDGRNFEEWLRETVEHWQDGRIKMYLVRSALNFRRKNPELFSGGGFIPLEAQGRYASNVVAFLRRAKDSCALVVVPRWLSQISESESPHTLDWDDTRVVVPDANKGDWTSVLSGAKLNAEDNAILKVDALFGEFPVALCYRG